MAIFVTVRLFLSSPKFPPGRRGGPEAGGHRSRQNFFGNFIVRSSSATGEQAGEEEKRELGVDAVAHF